MKNSGYEKVFQDASVWRSIFRMAVPSLLTIVIMIFYNMADTFFIAQLGNYTKVASVSIVTPVFSMIMALSTMIGAGGSAVIAGDIGADNREKAMNDSSTCFYAAVILGIVLSACLLMFPDPLLRMLGTKPEMWNDSAAYLRILSCGTIFMLIPSAMGMIVRAEGAVKEGLIGNMSGTVGQAQAIQAIRIVLTGDIAKTHNIYYRTHISEYGWLDWTSNGKISGSEGLNKSIESYIANDLWGLFYFKPERGMNSLFREVDIRQFIDCVVEDTRFSHIVVDYGKKDAVPLEKGETSLKIIHGEKQLVLSEECVENQLRLINFSEYKRNKKDVFHLRVDKTSFFKTDEKIDISMGSKFADDIEAVLKSSNFLF